jgi:hypothetical protein
MEPCSLRQMRKAHRQKAEPKMKSPAVTEPVVTQPGVQEQQESALYLLRSLVEHPAFGMTAECPELLRDCVRGCLEAGLPASQKALTELLLPHAVFLLDDPEFPLVSRHLKAELRRRQRQEAPVKTVGNTVDELDARLLLQVRTHTCSRRILMVGGYAAGYREHQERIGKLLATSEIEWVTRAEIRNTAACEPYVDRVDIVVLLTRFMSHTLSGIAKQCAQKRGKRLVTLPGGLGVNNVLRQFAQQLG